ncbi:Hypothetical protein PHPALM_18572 [Phytophthora palmivora]|uniref:PX domain-containing protein n=1 Tax=Phytophthora palmivora TaxID=4796 RepID=A0A2P4XJE3_9STRA|nr:Hypothetical protein PHPALM_18572 [Phytophthora palmivora]
MQLERAMRNYDSLGAQVRPMDPLGSTASSALMQIVRTPDPQTQKVRKSRSLALPALPNIDLDEIEIPEMHEGLCRVFCQPNSWSPAFASPGDFTIKMASVFLDNGEICFRIAQRALNEFGDEVIQFLSFVMQITTIGFNKLVTLQEPVSNNDKTSIDRDYQVPGLTLTSINRSGAGKCVRFIDPGFWMEETPNDGSFTVEMSSVTVMDGVAKFAISVLFYANGELQTITVNRRYSEFDELTVTLAEKIPSLHLRKLLPPKTFFRYLSASFLERRAAQLQLFLEHVLRLNFQGVLDQEIPLTAEPRVREFLKLPAVEWIVVPWSKQSPTPKATRDGFRSNFSLSPTAPSEFSPRYNFSPRRNPRRIPIESTTPRYESFMLKRSDSM